MLLPLHGAILTGPDHASFQLLLPNHFLIFLIWLLLNRKPGSSALFPVLATLFILPVILWEQGLITITGWLSLLSALFIARISKAQGAGWQYLGVCLYCLYAQFVFLVPEISGQTDRPSWVVPGMHLLLGLGVITSFIPLPRTSLAQDQQPDPIITLLCLIALVGIAPLSLQIMATTDLGYVSSLGLATALLLVCAPLALLFSGFSFKPGATGSGVIRNEQQGRNATHTFWIETIAEIAEHETHPAEFLELALLSLQDMDQLTGCQWQSGSLTGGYGSPSDFVHSKPTKNLRLSFSFSAPVSSKIAKDLDEKILLLDLYVENLRLTQKLRAQSHMEAIYETGARITHDVKNVLQSLGTLNNAVQNSRPEQASDLQQMLQQQLPRLTHRIERTLDKLQAPDQISSTFQVARLWWAAVKSRYEGSGIQFSEDIQSDVLVPRDLFDRVAENLLENAKRKQQVDADISIQARLEIDSDQILMAVCDTGTNVPKEIEKELFQSPVESSGGYGIGLYQCAQQAEAHGFKLHLENNEQGEVCFLLAGKTT